MMGSWIVYCRCFDFFSFIDLLLKQERRRNPSNMIQSIPVLTLSLDRLLISCTENKAEQEFLWIFLSETTNEWVSVECRVSRESARCEGGVCKFRHGQTCRIRRIAQQPLGGMSISFPWQRTSNNRVWRMRKDHHCIGGWQLKGCLSSPTSTGSPCLFFHSWASFYFVPSILESYCLFFSAASPK